MLLRNYSRSQERDKFWKDYEEKGLPFILKKYGDYGNIAFLKRYIVRGKNLVKRIIKREG